MRSSRLCFIPKAGQRTVEIKSPTQEKEEARSVRSGWTKVTFETEPSQTKPRMVKYQIRRGTAGLGGRIVRVPEEVPAEEEYQSVKPLVIERQSQTSQSKFRQTHSFSQNSEKSRTFQKSAMEPVPEHKKKISFKKLHNEFVRNYNQQQSQQNQNQNQKDDSPVEDIQTKNEESIKKVCGLNQQDKLLDDYQFIDQIPLSHPIWKQVFPEDVYTNPNVNLKKLILDNFEYFHHQLQMCACFKCECGLCKCDFSKGVKINFNIGQASVYEKDFQDRITNYNELKPLNQTTHETKFNEQKLIDLQSTQRVKKILKYFLQHTYKPFQINPREKLTKTPYQQKLDHTGMSTYQAVYGNWGEPNHQLFKRPLHISTSDEMPFYGQTLYQNSYINPVNYKPAELVKSQTALTPLPMGKPFMTLTQSQRTYQPFKIFHTPKIKQLSPNGQDNQRPQYDAQYQSLMNRDYDQKHLRICPAKVFNKLLKRRIEQKLMD